jgi:hypothetical protein
MTSSPPAILLLTEHQDVSFRLFGQTIPKGARPFGLVDRNKELLIDEVALRACLVAQNFSGDLDEAVEHRVQAARITHQVLLGGIDHCMATSALEPYQLIALRLDRYVAVAAALAVDVASGNNSGR